MSTTVADYLLSARRSLDAARANASPGCIDFAAKNIRDADAELVQAMALLGVPVKDEGRSATKDELYEALDGLSLVVGLTAFKYESQRSVLQEAVDRARALVNKRPPQTANPSTG